MKTSKHILKKGKILKNWLVDFPQNILTQKNAYYELVIGDEKLTLLIDFNLTKTTDFTLSLPLIIGKQYDCTIDWGDNTSEILNSNNIDKITHTYTEKNNVNNPYKVKISGIFPGFNNYFYEKQYNKNAWEHLLAIEDWGITNIESLDYRIL